MAEVSCPLLATWPGFRGQYHKGHMRCARALRRRLAVLRQVIGQLRDHERQLAAQPVPATPRPWCLWPWKDRFGSQAEASGRLATMRRKVDKKRRIEPFQCRAGHWHLGRHVGRGDTARARELARAGDSR